MTDNIIYVEDTPFNAGDYNQADIERHLVTCDKPIPECYLCSTEFGLESVPMA